MTAIAIPARPGSRPRGRTGWLEVSLLLVGFSAIVTARAAASRAGLDPLAVGAGFAGGLLALAAAGGARRSAGRIVGPGILGPGIVGPAIVGAAVGAALVAAGVAGPALAGVPAIPGLARPSAPFVTWAAIIVGVAVAEEAVLRGVLFDHVRRVGGALPAVLVTTVAFALLHVPLYGWHVVPLDLAVGLALGGLRIATGGVVAPAIAHAVADLATWWL